MKIKFITILFLYTFIAHSQISPTILDSIAKQSCACLKDKNLNNTSKSEDNLKMDIGICIIEKYQNIEDKIDPKDRVSFNDQEGLRKIGEQVAIKMFNYCPDIILKLGETALEEADNKPKSATEETKSNLTAGTLLEIKTEQFTTFVFKDNKNKIHQLLLLDYFDTAHLFRENKIKKNDKIKVDYSEFEFYDPKIKDFRYFKVLTYLEKI